MSAAIQNLPGTGRGTADEVGGGGEKSLRAQPLHHASHGPPPRTGEVLEAPRGKLTPNAPLAPLVWFKSGGLADWLFEPKDSDDLSTFLANLDPAVAVMALGLGSNLIVRDGGWRGVVVRLGKALQLLRGNHWQHDNSFFFSLAKHSQTAQRKLNLRPAKGASFGDTPFRPRFRLTNCPGSRIRGRHSSFMS